jgi:ribosomal protein S18 acetylase RimI-like enzyme
LKGRKVRLSLELVSATESDLASLAQMNKGLIDDEGSQNPMTIYELEKRMRGWLISDWNIDVIYKNSEIAGYALYQFRQNQYFTEEKEVYLRQYYIKPAFRRQGIGHDGIILLKENRFNDAKTVTIDVLVENQRGLDFWRKVGFIPYSMSMKTSTQKDKY